MTLMRMRKGRTNMSPGISFSARVIVFLPQSAREMSATLYGTWPKKSQWEILRIFWPISFLHNLLKSSIWRFYLVLYSCEFTFYLCYIIPMYDVQKDLNIISKPVQHEPFKVDWCCLNSNNLQKKIEIKIQLRHVQKNIQSNEEPVDPFLSIINLLAL